MKLGDRTMRIRTVNLIRGVTGVLVMLAALKFTVRVAGQSTAPTPEQISSAAKLLDEVKAGIARFADVQAAQADGYQRRHPIATAAGGRRTSIIRPTLATAGSSIPPGPKRWST